MKHSEEEEIKEADYSGTVVQWYSGSYLYASNGLDEEHINAQNIK